MKFQTYMALYEFIENCPQNILSMVEKEATVNDTLSNLGEYSFYNDYAEKAYDSFEKGLHRAIVNIYNKFENDSENLAKMEESFKEVDEYFKNNNITSNYDFRNITADYREFKSILNQCDPKLKIYYNKLKNVKNFNKKTYTRLFRSIQVTKYLALRHKMLLELQESIDKIRKDYNIQGIFGSVED